MLIVKRRLQVACLWQYPPRRPANHQFYRVKNPMSSHRLSPLSAPVSGVLRFLSLLCLALPLLAASAWAASEPCVASIARMQPGPVTTADTLQWRVTFTEAVTGVTLPPIFYGTLVSPSGRARVSFLHAFSRCLVWCADTTTVRQRFGGGFFSLPRGLGPRARRRAFFVRAGGDGHGGAI
jgi:hypothetical protein